MPVESSKGAPAVKVTPARRMGEESRLRAAAAAVRPPPPAPVVSVAKPVPVVSVERKVAPVELDFRPGPVKMPPLYTRGGRLIVPPALKGSHEILLHQNEMADRDGLDRVQDDDDLDRMREAGLLVAIPRVAGLESDDRLPADRRFCRPWTAEFLRAVSRAHFAQFHTALQVNSAVRTVAVQERLLRTNGNAAPVAGETASPHLTGQAVDLAKHGLSRAEVAWLRGYLLPLMLAGKIDVEEEFQQSCFHISVYKQYVPPTPAKRQEIAQAHRAVSGRTPGTR